MKKNCVKCNFSLSEDAKFCPECGEKQPDLSRENQKAEYSASIGDKNVISGNIIGKSEEYNITGQTTINKIEDETKKFITCAVSGKHLLRGRDVVVNCPKCKSDVAQECFTMSAGRCFNCDKNAFAEYRSSLDVLLADGIIDASERIQLDSLAFELSIDNENKQRIESEAKATKVSKNFNAQSSTSSLNPFWKIQFNKALSNIFEQNNFSEALESLFKIHAQNQSNDEVASIYYLLKAVQQPTAYNNDYANAINRSVDIYWEDFWAFLSNLNNNNPENCFKIIEENKLRFADNSSDVLLSEIIAYVHLYKEAGENDWLNAAQDANMDLGENIKQPIQPLSRLVKKLLVTSPELWNGLIENFTREELFYFNHVIGHSVSKHEKTSNSEKQIKSVSFENEITETTSQNNPIEFETVQIGDMHWTTKYLKTETFQNGEKIPVATSFDEWLELCRAEKPAMCYYEFNPKNHALYNFYAINSKSRLTPEGFNIPAFHEDYNQFENIFTDTNINTFNQYIKSSEGILRIGRDAQTGRSRKEFSNIKMIATTDRFDDIDDSEDDCIGVYSIEINDKAIEYNLQNGFWGFPVLLVKNQDTNSDINSILQKEEENNETLTIIEDELINLSQLSGNNYNINFKAKFLQRLNFEFVISHAKIVLKSINTRILISQNNYDLWLEPDKSETKYLNQGTGSNSIKITIPTADGQLFPDWKKNILSDEDDKDILITIERYPASELEFGFNLVIGKHSKKYRLKFGKFSFNILMDKLSEFVHDENKEEEPLFIYKKNKYGDTIKIQVANKDFDTEMAWKDAKNACSKLGESWRLPEEKELDLIFNKLFLKNKGGFKKATYWCSNKNKGCQFNLNGKFTDLNFNELSIAKYFVRAVKD